jgi:hypothetical protein
MVRLMLVRADQGACAFVFMFFPLTAQADFESIAQLNLALIQFDKASIRSQQSESLPR